MKAVSTLGVPYARDSFLVFLFENWNCKFGKISYWPLESQSTGVVSPQG